MNPGVVYTAPDGSTVRLQYVIQEGTRFYNNMGTPAEFRIYQPDRVLDIRLLEEGCNGQRVTSYIRSKGGTVPDSPYEMRAEPWPDDPPGLLSLPGETVIV